jgi:CheY-like chemotaxis protein
LIRHAGLDLPIVAVTATMPEVSRDKSFAAGMTGYMNKPVRLKELKKTLIEASQARRRKATAAATSEA